MSIEIPNLSTESGALFSPCRQHRYVLWRTWDSSLPRAMCIGINPSKADATNDDPTVRLLKRLLSRLGYGGFALANLFTFISPKPDIQRFNTVNEEMENVILTTVGNQCDCVIFCWGRCNDARDLRRSKRVAALFIDAKCFGKNKDASPRHPRALSYQGVLETAVLCDY